MMHLDAGKAASTFRDEEPASTLRSTQCHAQLSQVHNPMLESAERRRVRDPAVRVLEGGVRELYYTLYEGEPKNMWSDTTGYTVQVVTTTDWHTFSSPQPVTPTGYCSPDAPVEWRGSPLLAFQAYPDKALGGPRSGLFVARRLSEPGRPASWGPPVPFFGGGAHATVEHHRTR